MRIDRPSLRGTSIVSSGVYGLRNPPPVRGGGKATGAGTRIDAIHVSGAARETYQVYLAVQRAPEVREEVIAPLRQAVEAGTYYVPAEKIAEGILREALFWARWYPRGG